MHLLLWAGDLTAVTLAINHSIFIESSYFKSFRIQEGVARSQSGSLVTKVAHIGQKSAKIRLNTPLSAPAGDPTADIGNQLLYFHQMILI